MENEILSPQTEYKYAPLQELRSVRLLKLYLEGPYEAPVRISLREVSLESSVRFAALSYTWTTEDGDCSLSKCVECDGSIIRVTANCDAVLRRIRQHEIFCDFWIDAICINQSNDDEKSLQVPLMGQIYRTANWVALWIGEASCTLDEETSRPVTDLAMELLLKFGVELQQIEDSGRNPRDGTLYQEVVGERIGFRHRGVAAFSPAVRGLWEIFHRPWWQRVWVAQEISLAKTALLICGSQLLPFDMVEMVINGLVRQHPGKSGDEHAFCADFVCSTFPHFMMREFVKRTQLQSDFTWSKGGPGQKAIEILDNTRNLHATDPRDKIYGIQGFFGDPESDPENIFPAPDYSKTTAEVYADVARTIIIKTKTLDVLSTCYGCVFTIPDLPSWAPSWNDTPLQYFTEAPFKAANDSQVVYEASEDNRLLKVKGKRVDVLKHVPEIQGQLVYNHLECTRLWRQWTDLAFSLQSYPTGESITDVLLHTLCWDSNTAWNRLARGEYRENFEAWLKILQSSNPLETIAKDLYEDEMASQYTHRAQFLLWARCLSTTMNSYLALVPMSASPHDQIVVLSGGKLPFVLRAEGSSFRIIGPCYVHGIMDGQAFPKDEAGEDLEWFTLC